MSEIKCPYCGAEDDDCISDIWEYEGSDNEAECASCEKSIIVNAEVQVTYEAVRPECDDDHHEYGGWVRCDIDQKTLDRWKTDRLPYSFFSRDCSHCDDTDYSIDYQIGVELEQEDIKSRCEGKA